MTDEQDTSHADARSRSNAGLGGVDCQCRQCLRDRKEGDEIEGFGFMPTEMTRMICCQKCGNKRCPHATDHRLECTGSNEPGQAGSAYENCKPHNVKLTRPPTGTLEKGTEP